MNRLSEASPLPPDVRSFGHDRARTKVGIVHLGIGAFHRAHMADYTQDVLDAVGGDWAVLGVSLRSAMVRDQLVPQDGLYTLVERSGAGERTRLIGAVADVKVAPEDPDAVMAAIAAPQTAIVSLTVTEKGYCHRPATGDLDCDHPGIRHDLATPERPVTAPGYLVAGLAARRRAGLGGLTLLSCDNLPDNGRVLAGVVHALARAREPALADWIATACAFPSTMVDRIVPATTPEDIAAQAARLGVRDEGLVKAEPFRQWVIEDRFAGPRPAWELAGAQLVAEVAPFETAKLRLLNGSHTGIALLGQLSGWQHVHEAIAEPAMAAFVGRLMDEAAATLAPTPGLDVARYRADLMARFANPALMHRTGQIAIDSSQKLPQRLLGTVSDRLAAGGPIDAHALAVAAFIAFASGIRAEGPRVAVDDPLAERFLAVPADSVDRLLDGFLGIEAIFGADLPADPRFRAAVRAALAVVLKKGAAAALEEASWR